ncbi:MAG: DNA (cytosine-5-)-methyltransferase [Candidatus Cloacimonetes bacterium 4572_65]|nr:MAG: DNA (cytosine-5-)-methyltransferase [Candidatus Cloacimonetes bacterium 4572_65]
MFTVGSLFAGIGGICQAFESTGFRLDWANEIDKNACKTYRANFDHTLYEDDICNLTLKPNIKKLPRVDVLTSGFPCQAFSIAGYQKGFDDPRGNLFFEVAKIIEETQPKVVLLENVKNLVSHNKGDTFKTIRDIITDKLGYSFVPFILNSKLYGNIPQTRERIYIVCFRGEAGVDNLQGEFPFYTHTLEDKYRELVNSRNVSSTSCTANFVIPKPIPLTKTINDLLDKDIQEELFYYRDSQKYYEILNKEITSRDTIYQWRRTYVRENKSNVCPTLTANMGTGGHNVPIIRDDFGIRKLTPRECSRFQGFKEEYLLEGLAKSHLYKQIGNSVTIPVIERIAQEIKRVLTLKN